MPLAIAASFRRGNSTLIAEDVSAALLPASTAVCIAPLLDLRRIGEVVAPHREGRRQVGTPGEQRGDRFGPSGRYQ
jgi:hypothetical protein